MTARRYAIAALARTAAALLMAAVASVVCIVFLRVPMIASNPVAVMALTIVAGVAVFVVVFGQWSLPPDDRTGQKNG